MLQVIFLRKVYDGSVNPLYTSFVLGDTLGKVMCNSVAKKILVVDDEELILDFVKLTLRLAGYNVFVSGNAQLAMEIFCNPETPIDLAILDISLPGIGGGELGRSMREQQPHQPIIFMTGFSDDDLQRFGVTEPDSDVLLKPFLSRQLTEMVRGVLNRTVAQ